MYKNKTFKDFAIGLGVIGAIGGGAYLWNYAKQTGFDEGYNEGIYRASPQYKEIETMREEAKRIGMWKDDADFRIAVDKLKRVVINSEKARSKMEDVEIRMQVANKTLDKVLDEVLSIGEKNFPSKTSKTGDKK